ncbi:hypothetical protein MPER_11605 [Moniliophthora perniciosa FA553]|nr:hypothetical protein MPER_11605 [Moniliophthora perniciosa FA553]
MLFLVRRVLVIAALAKTVQAQAQALTVFSGIPNKTLVGSDLNVRFEYSGSIGIGRVSLDIVRDGESIQRRTIRIRISASSTGRTLTVPQRAGTYRVQATYDDSRGTTHRDLSDSFIVFAEGEDSGDLPRPSSTATFSPTTSESSKYE